MSEDNSCQPQELVAGRGWGGELGCQPHELVAGRGGGELGQVLGRLYTIIRV